MKLAVAAMAVCLQACAAAPLVVTGLGIGSVAVTETTGKSVTDHTVSTVKQQDCRVARAFRNQDMCQTAVPDRLSVVTTGVVPSTVQEIESKYR